jgi:hypothetical protein
VTVVGITIVVGLVVGKVLGDLADAFNISGSIAMALDRASQQMAEEEARKARGQRISRAILS